MIVKLKEPCMMPEYKAISRKISKLKITRNRIPKLKTTVKSVLEYREKTTIELNNLIRQREEMRA